jgi:hypothetical protein
MADTYGPLDTGYITFDNGVPVGGYAQLTLHQDGSYLFGGHFHVSGAPSYNTAFAFVVWDARGTAYTFSHTGRVHGTLEPGSRDDDWVIRGTNPALAAGWADLWANGAPRSQWNAKVDLDLGVILKSLVEAAATVIAIV